MNWMGGARNRIKKSQERKRQQEFFAKKRMEKKMNMNCPRKYTTGISQDLITLHTISNFCDYNPLKADNNINQFRRVDLESRNSRPYKNLNELPMSPITSQSVLSLMGDKENAKPYNGQNWISKEQIRERKCTSWKDEIEVKSGRCQHSHAQNTDKTTHLFHLDENYNPNLDHMKWLKEYFKDESTFDRNVNLHLDPLPSLKRKEPYSPYRPFTKPWNPAMKTKPSNVPLRNLGAEHAAHCRRLFKSNTSKIAEESSAPLPFIQTWFSHQKELNLRKWKPIAQDQMIPVNTESLCEVPQVITVSSAPPEVVEELKIEPWILDKESTSQDSEEIGLQLSGSNVSLSHSSSGDTMLPAEATVHHIKDALFDIIECIADAEMETKPEPFINCDLEGELENSSKESQQTTIPVSIVNNARIEDIPEVFIEIDEASANVQITKTVEVGTQTGPMTFCSICQWKMMCN